MASQGEVDRLVSLEDLQDAYKVIKTSPHCWRTPMLSNVQQQFNIKKNVQLFLKLENMQCTGSFKPRGVLYQLHQLPEENTEDQRTLITMSAGNYGKAFAMLISERGIPGMVLMPVTAARNRIDLIKSYGVKVEEYPMTELHTRVDEHVEADNMVFLHCYDDNHMIAGNGSIGFEILEELPDPDIVIVCCGGGGLLAGIASCIKLAGQTSCRIYGVEPETACSMHKSFITGKAETIIPESKTPGLASPYAGKKTYEHCKAFVEGILLVSDHEIQEATRFLYNRGLVVETGGAAAFAALRHDKVPDVENKKVVVIVTGGNVTPDELVKVFNK